MVTELKGSVWHCDCSFSFLKRNLTMIETNTVLNHYFLHVSFRIFFFFLKRNKLKTLDPNWWLQRISSNQTTSSFIFHLNIRFEVLVRRNSGPRMDLWVLIHGFESIHTYHLNLSLWIYMMFMSLITNLSSSFVPKSIQKKVDQEQFERWNWFFKTFFDYFSF